MAARCSTSWPEGARRGAQAPRAEVLEGEEASTDGPDAAALIADLGMELLPWQRRVLDRWCARDASDAPAYATCGLSVPRQNGKNAVLEAFEVYEAVAAGWHVLHTAHRQRTSKKSFQRLVRWFTSPAHPELRRMVRAVRYTNGEESITLQRRDPATGQVSEWGGIEFSARSRAAARGFDDINLVVFDEAQDLTDDQQNALLYTLAAARTGERVLVYTGTPPDASSPGEVFGRIRARALAGLSRSTCWEEWGVEEPPRPGASFEDVLEGVYAANPSMGYLLSEDYTRTEFGDSALDGFARERMGWWEPEAGSEAAIPRELWDESSVPAIGGGYSARYALAVKFSPDGARYALAGCKADGKGAHAFELVELGSTARGVRGLARALWERRGRACCVVVDGQSGAPALCDALADLGCPRGYVVRPSAADVAAAAGLLLDGLREGSAKHTAEGQEALDDSALTSARRPIGSRGSWGFGSAENHDSAPIEAASLALWGAKSSKRDPKRRQVLL